MYCLLFGWEGIESDAYGETVGAGVVEWEGV